MQTLLGMECVVHPRQISESMDDIGGLNSIIGDLVRYSLRACIDMLHPGAYASCLCQTMTLSG